MKTRSEEATWLQRLLLLCQVCGTWAQKSELQAEIPWDLYLAVLILGVAIIGLWEGVKYCVRGSVPKVKTLSAQANRTSKGKLARSELKELQVLLSMNFEDLAAEQKERMIDLREKFDATMPEGCSPVPRFNLPREDHPEVPMGEQASSSTTPTVGRNKQPRPRETRDQATQADYEPVFQRVEPPPPPRREVISGPFYQVPGRDHLHVFRECWGLRNAGTVQRVTLCRCCLENGGNRIY